MPVSTLGGGGSSQKSQVHVFPPTPSIDTHQTSPGQMPVWTAPDDRKEIGVSGPDNARHIRSNVPEAFSRAFSELPTTRPEPGESTRQTSGDGRRNPGAGAVGLSSRFRSFRISNAQRGVERRSLHLNWFRSVTYLLISDSKIGGGCRGKNGSLFLRDKLPCRSVRFVPSGPSHRLAVSRDGDPNDVDRFSVAFLGLLDGVLVNALHRDHGIAEIPFEGRFRSVQLGGVTLPGRVGEVKRVAFQLHGKHERILRHVQVFCRAPGTRNSVRSLRSMCHPLHGFL